MPLFHEKVIIKALNARSQNIPAEHLPILQSWKEKGATNEVHSLFVTTLERELAIAGNTEFIA